MKVFGCSDDCARCTAKGMNCAKMTLAFGRRCGFASGRLLGATGSRMEPYNWKAKPISQWNTDPGLAGETGVSGEGWTV